MYAKLALSLLFLISCTKAEDVSTVDLAEDIKYGKLIINQSLTDSLKYVASVENKFREDSYYYYEALKAYRDDGMRSEMMTYQKVNVITKKYVGIAIDKNKNINTFKCIFNANNETKNAIRNGMNSFERCIWTAYDKKNEELDNTRSEVNLIRDTVKGLYDILYNSLDECKDSTCVTELVHRAQSREGNVKKVMAMYFDKSGDLRNQFNQAQMDCIRTLNTIFDSSVKNCENKMKNC